MDAEKVPDRVHLEFLQQFHVSHFFSEEGHPEFVDQAKELFLREFPKNQMTIMNPAEIENRDPEIDSLSRFGTL